MPRRWSDEIEAAGGAAAAMTADVGDPDAATALVAATVERFGRLDVLVNNASVRREIDFADLDYQEWREHSGDHPRRRLSVQPRGVAAPDGFGPWSDREHRRAVVAHRRRAEGARHRGQGRTRRVSRVRSHTNWRRTT